MVYSSEKEKLKVLFAYHEDLSAHGLGSIGTYILEILRYLRKLPECSYRYLGPEPRHTYPECLSPESYRSYPPAKSHQKWLPETLRIMQEFYRYRHFAKNSLVSVHRWEQAIPFLFTKNRGPVILTIHGSGEFTSLAYRQQYFLRFFHWWMEKWALRKVDKVVLISRNAFDFYHKKYPRWSAKYVYIPTFVSEKSFYPILREKALEQLGVKESKLPIFLYVGRLVPEKNVNRMIDLVEHYCQTISPAQFWIVGDGPEKENLQKKVAEKNLSQVVLFWGSVSHDKLLYIYNAADVLFLFSEFEGTPLTLLESLACGTPCLGTPVGDLPNIIQNELNGFIIDKNNREDLIKKLVTVIQSKDTFRANSLNSVNPYQAGNVVPQIVDYYIQVQKDYAAQHK